MNQNINFTYQPKTEKQLKNWFNNKVSQKKNGFKSFNEFFDWYEKKEKVCHYCGLKEEESQFIVINGLLASKRFPENGIISRGRNRGVWLEMDKINPLGLYDINNCVLSCYFCNNDKSDVFDKDGYQRFFQNRYEYLKSLINKYTRIK